MANPEGESNLLGVSNKILYPLHLCFSYGLFQHLQINGKLKGVQFNNETNPTHLLFADDIVLFIEDSEESINSLKNAIFLFEKASGLNINLSKSSISPINMKTS